MLSDDLVPGADARAPVWLINPSTGCFTEVQWGTLAEKIRRLRAAEAQMAALLRAYGRPSTRRDRTLVA